MEFGKEIPYQVLKSSGEHSPLPSVVFLGSETNRIWIGNKSDLDRKQIGFGSEPNRIWIGNEMDLDRK